MEGPLPDLPGEEALLELMSGPCTAKAVSYCTELYCTAVQLSGCPFGCPVGCPFRCSHAGRAIKYPLSFSALDQIIVEAPRGGSHDPPPWK